MADEPVIRPFADFLIDVHGGKTAVELAEKFHEVIEGVKTFEKQGSITLTITVTPMKDVADTMLVTADVKAKIPEAKRKGAVFFTDDHGNLVRDNPALPRLPLREVGGPKIEPDAEPIDAASKDVTA